MAGVFNIRHNIAKNLDIVVVPRGRPVKSSVYGDNILELLRNR